MWRKKERLRDNDVGRYQLHEIRTESDKTYCNRKREVGVKFDTKTGETELIILSEDDDYGKPCVRRNYPDRGDASK
ncbi:MAG: hypothetical protein ACKVG7_03810 [Flavobacteriales bacterium]